jgi:methyltransferase, FkbM family
MGHEVALAPNYGYMGGAVEANNTRIYPMWREKIGQDVLPYHAIHWGAELVVTLYDAWPFDADFAARLKVPWAMYFPQDSYPPCTTVVERAKQADYPIAMSKFGVTSMAEQGVDCAYIPHGVDTTTYAPMDKSLARKGLKLPEDKFIVLMVAANQSFPSRKAFPENLAGFARFHKDHPDSMLYLHTTRMPRGAAWDGVEMMQLVRALGIEDAVTFTDEYAMVIGLADEDMARIYNAADVLLSASMGEGFGVPIIEAQSCGIPVITTDFSAMTEITLNGIRIKPIQESWTALNTWMAIPPISGIQQALTMIYEESAEDKQQKAYNTRQKIIQDYSWTTVIEHWRLFLEGVERGEKPSPERIYPVSIKGVEFNAIDDKQSFTVPCVESELNADTYNLERIDFQPGDIILDIGAHVGVFALYMAERWPGVRVISYEPSTTNYQRLLRNLKPNADDLAIAPSAICHLENGSVIEAHNLAVTADGRDIELSYARGNTGGTTALRKVNGHLVEHAKSTTLDAIIDGLSKFVGEVKRVRFLKIDAEGMEHSILKAATLLDRVDFLSGEFHINTYLQQQGNSIEGLYEYLKGHIPAERIAYTSCRMDD